MLDQLLEHRTKIQLVTSMRLIEDSGFSTEAINELERIEVQSEKAFNVGPLVEYV